MADIEHPKRTLCQALAALSPNMKAAILTAVVLLLLSAFGSFYTLGNSLGYSQGAKDLEAVNDFKKLDLPALTGNLQELAKDFRDRATLDAQNKQLSKNLAEKEVQFSNVLAEKEVALRKLRSDDDNAHAQTASLQKHTGELEREISAIFPVDETKITVKDKRAEKVLSNQITIGVNDAYESFLDTKINGNAKDMHVGDIYTVPLPLAHRECNVTLMSIENKQGEFAVSCILVTPR